MNITPNRRTVTRVIAPTNRPRILPRGYANADPFTADVLLPYDPAEMAAEMALDDDADAYFDRCNY